MLLGTLAIVFLPFRQKSPKPPTSSRARLT
jgi:hypothetical protein